jgi:hypothetical protein
MQTGVSDPYSFDPGIRIQDFYNQKFEKKKTAEKFIFVSKTIIYLSLASIKYVQAKEEAFSFQKRTSSTSKHEIS